jgi:hypothetical protein
VLLAVFHQLEQIVSCDHTGGNNTIQAHSAFCMYYLGKENKLFYAFSDKASPFKTVNKQHLALERPGLSITTSKQKGDHKLAD